MCDTVVASDLEMSIVATHAPILAPQLRRMQKLYPNYRKRNFADADLQFSPPHLLKTSPNRL